MVRGTPFLHAGGEVKKQSREERPRTIAYRGELGMPMTAKSGSPTPHQRRPSGDTEAILRRVQVNQVLPTSQQLEHALDAVAEVLIEVAGLSNTRSLESTPGGRLDSSHVN